MRAVVVAMLVAGCTSNESVPETEAPVPAPVRGPGTWDPRFALPGVSLSTVAEVNAEPRLARRRDGSVLVDGHFDRPAPDVATWDGTTWSTFIPLGQGARYVEDAAGTLWARAATSLWRLETSWVQVADGLVESETIVAYADGIAIANGDIELWTSTAPTTITSPVTFPPWLAVVGNTLCERTYSLCWTGTTWEQIGPVADVHVLARDGEGTWWGAGWFDDGGLYLTKLEATAWVRVGPRLGSPSFPEFTPNVFEIAFQGAAILVGGSRLLDETCHLVKWDGSAWLCLARSAPAFVDGVNARVSSILVDGERIHIGGRFLAVNNATAANVATLDASSLPTAWSLGEDHVAVSGYASSLRMRDGLLRAAGSLYLPNGAATDAEFNGLSWTASSSRPASQVVETLDGTTYWTNDVGGAYRDDEPLESDLHISSLAIHDGAVYALGRGDVDEQQLLRVRGGGFERVADALDVFRLASVPTLGLVGVGSTIAVWDGVAWRDDLIEPPVDFGAFSNVSAITPTADGFYVSYPTGFSEGERLTGTIQFFDGAQFIDIAPVFAHAMVASPDGLYVGVETGTAVELLH